MTAMAVLLCVALVAVELGWVPWVRYAWGFNLWRYQPPWLAWTLAALVLALCWGRVREVVAQGASALASLAQRRGPPALPWLTALLVPIALWLVRERQLQGDAPILLYVGASGIQFLFPDVGASYLFHLAHRIGVPLGVTGRPVLQVLVCLAGGITVVSLARVARRLTASPARAALFTVLVLAGGLTRVLAGHVEVYGFILACAAVYLWAALAFLQGARGVALPALALGVGVWMHLSFVFLVPSLLLLLYLGTPPSRAPVDRARVMGALALVGVPTLAFLLLMVLAGHGADVAGAWRTMLEWARIRPSPIDHEAFLRLPLRAAGAGTRYVILSGPHLKYLLNAFFLLIPWVLPAMAALLVLVPRRFVATAEAKFLSGACLGMLAYTAVVRPVWGPYDWDLFSLTAVCLAALAAYLLIGLLDDPQLGHVAVLAIGASVLGVTIPFLIVGIAPAREAGPFALPIAVPSGAETPVDAVERLIRDWL